MPFFSIELRISAEQDQYEGPRGLQPIWTVHVHDKKDGLVPLRRFKRDAGMWLP